MRNFKSQVPMGMSVRLTVKLTVKLTPSRFRAVPRPPGGWLARSPPRPGGDTLYVAPS